MRLADAAGQLQETPGVRSAPGDGSPHHATLCGALKRRLWSLSGDSETLEFPG